MKRQVAEYEVTGNRVIRGYRHGAIFRAEMSPLAEARAVARGDIRLIRRITPTIPPGYWLPAGWLNQNEEVQ